MVVHLRADPHRCNCGNGNILYGFILTTVRVNSNLMTFVRDTECYGLQHMYPRKIQVEFLCCRRRKSALTPRHKKYVSQNDKCKRNKMDGPLGHKSHLTLGLS
jgi:hypothetical protein